MPFERHRYPPGWESIRRRILTRAANHCERCGVKNGAVGYRKKNGDFVQLAKDVDSVGMEVEVADLVDGFKILTIVLTIAHIGPTKYDKMDCRDEVLLALCQRCHLLEDIDEHRVRRSATLAKRKAVGMLQLGI